MASYDEVFADWKELWSIGVAYDMTGAYVDQDDLDMLLRSPTKRTATICLKRQIEHWFHAGIEGDAAHVEPKEVVRLNPQIDRLAEKYGFSHLIPLERQDAEGAER